MKIPCTAFVRTPPSTFWKLAAPTSEAKAITGHSTDQMVNHYAKKVNQRGQAREAIIRLYSLTKLPLRTASEQKVLTF